MDTAGTARLVMTTAVTGVMAVAVVGDMDSGSYGRTPNIGHPTRKECGGTWGQVWIIDTERTVLAFVESDFGDFAEGFRDT